MTLVRFRTRFGSVVALLALLASSVLSLGHSHPGQLPTGLAHLALHQDSAGQPGHDDGDRDHCAACAFIAQFQATGFAPPIALAAPLPTAFHVEAPSISATPLARAFAHFQSRAPPIA